MKNILLRTLVVSGILMALTFGLTLTAQADCTPDGTGASQTITCDTTTDMDGNGDNAVDQDGVYAGKGRDTIIIEAGATSLGNIEGGQAIDTITNNGTVDRYLSGDGGDDIITNNGEVNLAIVGARGSDTIDNNGVANGIYGGLDGDQITNTDTGVVDGIIDGGAGTDTITNNGTVNGDINANWDDDTVILSGDNVQVDGTVRGGSGTDTLDFSMSTSDETQYNDAKDVIATGGDGTFAWGTGKITWEEFETLIDNLILQATNPADENVEVGEAETGEAETPDEISVLSTSEHLVILKDSSSKLLSFIGQNAGSKTLLGSLSDSDCSQATLGQVLLSTTNDDQGVLLYVTALGNGQFSVQLYSVVDGSLLSNTVISG